jgi:hypothetical protein
MHVGLKGVMNEMYLAELGVRTHRGQKGNVLQGKLAGGNSYGYRPVPGRLGEREVHDAQAAIVRRVFIEYVDGISPKRIARSLNQEGVAGPRGTAWSPSTIHGQPRRGTGLLNNELYIGRIVWDRLKWATHPDTGRRLCRLKPREEWTIVDVEHLRIISDELWTAAKARQANARKGASLNENRRPRYLFSGLTKCAACEGGFTIFNHDNLFCFNARERGTCMNRRRIKRQELEQRVLTAMGERLFDPGLYAVFLEGYEAEMTELLRAHTASQAGQRQELARVERRIREIIAAIGEGFRSEMLPSELHLLENKRTVISLKCAAPSLPRLKPDLAHLYREKVARLAAGLKETSTMDRARQTLRSYIERIVIPPDGLLTVVGNQAAMLGIEPGGMVGCGGSQPPLSATLAAGRS